MISGNELLSSGNNPLPEPMLTKFYDAMGSLGHNELNTLFFIQEHAFENVTCKNGGHFVFRPPNRV